MSVMRQQSIFQYVARTESVRTRGASEVLPEALLRAFVSFFLGLGSAGPCRPYALGPCSSESKVQLVRRKTSASARANGS